VADRSETFLVWGSGGHGRVVAELARALGHRVHGFIDSTPARVGHIAGPGDAVVVASEEAFLASLAAGGPQPQGCTALAFGIGDNAARLARYGLASRIHIPPLIHPSATVSPSARIGRGSVVLARAVVHTGASIGEAVIVNSGAIVEHDCVLGDGVHVSPGAVLAGGVRVGARGWIGAGAVVIQGLRIGADAVVGAGAVILHDVADRATVVGNPGRVVRILPSADGVAPPAAPGAP